MKKIILLLCLLMVIVISGCATGHEHSGGNEKTSEHQGGCGH